ncbi:hypothetical protein ACGFYP_05725 [Streptomyces sp. NPDC048370]|uniref:hypothetical protein n=1 Tax=Streptomyces sp. NPDC048370 TaxID=3365540 RepID=UPI00371D975E
MSGTSSTVPAELRRLIAELTGPGGRPSSGGRDGEGVAVAVGADDSLAVARIRSTRPARRLARDLPGALPPTSAAALVLGELTDRHLAGSGARRHRLHDVLTTSPDTLPELLAALPEPSDGEADRLPPKSVCDTVAWLLEHAAPRTRLPR